MARRCMLSEIYARRARTSVVRALLSWEDIKLSQPFVDRARFSRKLTFVELGLLLPELALSELSFVELELPLLEPSCPGKTLNSSTRVAVTCMGRHRCAYGLVSAPIVAYALHTLINYRRR